MHLRQTLHRVIGVVGRAPARKRQLRELIARPVVSVAECVRAARHPGQPVERIVGVAGLRGAVDRKRGLPAQSVIGVGNRVVGPRPVDARHAIQRIVA